MFEVEKYLFFITNVTHNSRTSERMKRLGLKSSGGIWLSIEQELELTCLIASIVKKNNYKISTFNICGDHIHLILCCAAEELEEIMKKIKSTTSRKYKKLYNNKLWAQKFNRRIIENEDQLVRVVNYIEHNRLKHNLPESEKLQQIINRMLTPFDKLLD